MAMRVIHAEERLEVSASLVDSRGRACPLPIVDLAKALEGCELVELWADDPAALQDVVAFCDATGHRLVKFDRAPSFRGLIRRAGSAEPQGPGVRPTGEAGKSLIS
jgi:tRNA 2-thiouridine synthesizing protein A